MSRMNTAIVFCAALGLLPAAAQSKQFRVHQRFTGAALDLDGVNTDSTLLLKGAPGSATGRALSKVGPFVPPSDRCAGFDIEVPVLGGTQVTIFKDFSKVFASTTSGYLCVDLTTGLGKGHSEGTFVGGVGRFLNASGTWSEDEGTQVLVPGFPPTYPLPLSVAGTISGTIVVP